MYVFDSNIMYMCYFASGINLFMGLKTKDELYLINDDTAVIMEMWRDLLLMFIVYVV